MREDLPNIITTKVSRTNRFSIFFIVFFIISITALANNLDVSLGSNKLASPLIFQVGKRYHTYLEVGASKYFNQSSSAAMVYDLFIPLWQREDRLLFSDLRIFDRSGSQFEGNAYLGYRYLDEANRRIFGIYGAYDRKLTRRHNYFSQLTLGIEYWQDRFFLGSNIYRPVGTTARKIILESSADSVELYVSKRILSIQERLQYKDEKAAGGVDAEFGYEVLDNLVIYGGGYYFAGDNVKTAAGPKLRVTYDYTGNGINIRKGLLGGILHGVGLEVGIQHDQIRGVNGYLGIKLKFGMSDNNNCHLNRFIRHMVDLVRRDHDIVTLDTPIQTIYPVKDIDLFGVLERLEKSGNDKEVIEINRDIDQVFYADQGIKVVFGDSVVDEGLGFWERVFLEKAKEIAKCFEDIGRNSVFYNVSAMILKLSMSVTAAAETARSLLAITAPTTIGNLCYADDYSSQHQVCNTYVDNCSSQNQVCSTNETFSQPGSYLCDRGYCFRMSSDRVEDKYFLVDVSNQVNDDSQDKSLTIYNVSKPENLCSAGYCYSSTPYNQVDSSFKVETNYPLVPVYVYMNGEGIYNEGKCMVSTEQFTNISQSENLCPADYTVTK